MALSRLADAAVAGRWTGWRPLRRPRLSVLGRLLILVLSVLLPAAFIALSASVALWQADQRQVERQVLARAQMLAMAVASRVEVARVTLQTLATSPYLEAGDFASLHRQVALLPGTGEGDIVLSGRDGRALLTSAAPYETAMPPRGDAAQRGLARPFGGNDALLRRVFESGRPEVSDLFTGERGQALVAVDVPVLVGERVTYDLELALEPSMLRELLVRNAMPEGEVATLVDGRGGIVARSDLQEASIGQPAREDAAAARAPAADGTFWSTDADGRAMLVGFARVSGTGWSVQVGASHDRLTGALTQSLAVTIAVAMGLLSLGLLLAGYHARRIAAPLHALADAAGALGRHEFVGPVPSGVSEVSAVAAALAGTGAALRAREMERDEAEAGRRREQARHGRLLAMTPAGVIEFDAEGRICFVNPAAEAILGADQSAVLGGRLSDPHWHVTAPDGQPVAAGRWPVRRALTGETVIGSELAIDALDGRRRMLLMDLIPVHEDDGLALAGGACHGQPPVCGALAALQDVTARHAAALALRTSEAEFRTMADALPQVVWCAQPDGFIDYCNQRYYDDTGMPPGHPPGDSWRELIHPDDQPKVVARWLRSLRKGEPFACEYRLRRAGGAWRWSLSRAVAMRDEATGAVLRWFGTVTDIAQIVEARETLTRGQAELERLVAERTAALTSANAALQREARQREEAESALRQAHKMEALGQLTGGIAHDFNNMLQAIGGNLDMLRLGAGAAGGQDAVRYVDGAARMVERAAGLTRGLLAFSRQQALQPVSVPVKAMLKGMADVVQRAVGPAVEMRLEVEAGDSAILCDPNQLESAMLNLAINARDAMPHGGRLVVSARTVMLAAEPGARPGRYVELAMADSGVGMDAATLARAVEPFFTTKPMGQGTGLGLSQIHGFVRHSGGAMRLESAPGQGTVVTLAFPLQAPAAGVAAVAAEPAPAGRGGRVLLVEDEGGIRSIAAERLRASGYGVQEAASAADALAALAAGPAPDLLLTDLGLPGTVNGLDLAEAARAIYPGLPVLFITGYAGGVLQGELPAGMEVMTKPFRLAALAARIRVMLDGRGA